MIAIVLNRFGPPEALTVADVPDPAAGPGQAEVEVAFANVTFVETQLRAGGKGPFAAQLPLIPGNGVGGVVRRVGPGVDPALIGRRVISSTGGRGGYAQRAVVDAGGVFSVPADLELDAAVALLADGRTATWLMARVGMRAGERVLIEAAAGGVGTLAVQLARAAGARVIAAAGGPRKLELARELGADIAVDYRAADWPRRVRATVGGVDVVLDGVGGAIGGTAFELLERGGRMLSFGMASGAWADVHDADAAARGVTLLEAAPPTPAEVRSFTQRALAEAAAGRLRPVIGQRFPLQRAADAHRAIEERATVGKTLLEVTG